MASRSPLVEIRKLWREKNFDALFPCLRKILCQEPDRAIYYEIFFRAVSELKIKSKIEYSGNLAKCAFSEILTGKFLDLYLLILFSQIYCQIHHAREDSQYESRVYTVPEAIIQADDLVAEIEKALSGHTKPAVHYDDLAFVYFASGRYQAAADILGKMGVKKSARRHSLAAAIASAGNDHVAALVELEALLSIAKPPTSDFFVRAAATALAAGAVEKSRAFLLRQLDLNGDILEAGQLLRSISGCLDDPSEEGRKVHRGDVALLQDDVAAARPLLETGTLSRCLSRARSAEISLARLETRVGQYEMAIGRLQSVLDGAPDRALAWFHLGDAHRKKGNHGASVAAFRQGLEADPLLIEIRASLRAWASKGAVDLGDIIRLLQPMMITRNLRLYRPAVVNDIEYAKTAEVRRLRATSPLLHDFLPSDDRYPSMQIALDPWEALFFARTVTRSRTGILEIGRFRGGSALLAALLNSTVPVWSIDIDPVNDELLLALLAFFNRRNDTALLQGDSKQSFDDVGAYDFLFIDGDHTYEGVMADLRQWGHRIEPGGSIVLDDCGWLSQCRYALLDFAAAFRKEFSIKVLPASGKPHTAQRNGSHALLTRL